MTVVLGEQQSRPDALQDLARLVADKTLGLSPIFAAILYLLSRQIPPDLLHRMEAFLAGGKAPGQALRPALKQAGARGAFDFGRLTESALALQRARAYAELARWLGLDAGLPGLLVAAAITDDFASQIIAGRQDNEKLPERLRLKGLPRQADLALAAMRAIEAAPVLHPPAEADLQRHAETLRRGYALAYGWPAPPAIPAERRTNRTMRHHIRGWITQWDVLRLQGRAVMLEHGTIATNYGESDALAEDPPPPDE